MTEEKKYPEKYRVKVGQKAIIYNQKEKKFLLVKVIDKGWYFENMGPWEFIGGALDKEDKSLENSLVREIREEVGNIEFNVKNLIDRFEFTTLTGRKIFLGYLVEYVGGEIKLSDEHDEYKWMALHEIKESKIIKPWVKNFIIKAAEFVEKDNALNSWKRCQADFENYKKEQEKAREEFHKFAKMDVISQILPVLDNFEAALSHVPEKEKDSAWVAGITHIQRQIEDVLKNNGVDEIKVRAGDKFNPEIHEAVSGKGEKVCKVLRKGYRLNGKIIRVAGVDLGIPEDSIKTKIWQK